MRRYDIEWSASVVSKMNEIYNQSELVCNMPPKKFVQGWIALARTVRDRYEQEKTVLALKYYPDYHIVYYLNDADFKVRIVDIAPDI